MNTKTLIGLCLGAALLTACSTLQPGADPLVVRVEQTESIATAVFDTVVNVDQSNRSYWQSNAPAFHQFCEWLRAPQYVPSNVWITNVTVLPRGLAMIYSLNSVKDAYKVSKPLSNSVLSALATLESAMQQANAWLVITTNTTTR